MGQTFGLALTAKLKALGLAPFWPKRFGQRPFWGGPDTLPIPLDFYTIFKEEFDSIECRIRCATPQYPRQGSTLHAVSIYIACSTNV
jgi:hypothetical protein